MTYWDSRYDKEESATYQLWRVASTGAPAFVDHQGRRESPYTVAMLIATYVHGG